jgi:outer membrane protein OmpA-like peptidoglycan-associated protein
MGIQPVFSRQAGDGFSLSLAGVDDRGRPLGVTGDAALVLRRDNSALVEGRGFAPDSDVQVYVFSQARLLGTVHTDAAGAFSGLVQVPGDLELGHHTLQVDALHADGTVRSLSLGVVLQAPQVAASQRTARASVEFQAGSARLTPRAKKQLTSLARRAGATASGGMVVGYVQRDGNYATNQKLSAKRAGAVARFLRRHGVKASLVTRGNGALSLNETARKAVVTLRYTA